MKIGMSLAVALIGIVAASCGENAQPPAQTRTNLTQSTVQSSSQSTAKNDTALLQPPAPPADAQWTIFCDKVEGPTHVAEAQLRKTQLIQLSGMTDWYVIHTDTDSSIYYGYYRSLDNAAEKRRAETDRQRIAKLTDRLGNPLVRGDILQPVAAPDPQGPPEWNLLNTPRDAYWTIEIATFAAVPKRKEVAVEMVRELRAKGETQAYYYHGPTASSVCIGAWKREAVAEQGTGIDKRGQMRDDAHTASADQPLLVLSGIVPPNMPGMVYDPKTGKPMTVLAQKLVVLDPEMKAKMENPDYKYLVIDGKSHGVVDKGESYPDPSELVVIPHDEGVARQDDWRTTGGQSSPTPGFRPAPTSAGDSVLRSIGDH